MIAIRQCNVAHGNRPVFLLEARRAVFPNLKPSTATISLRLPQGMLDELKVLANQRDVPYQSLLKVFLSERIATERGRLRRRPRRVNA